MKIRTLTCFLDPQQAPFSESLTNLAAFTAEAAGRLQQIGFTLQTLRLATTPFPLWLGSKSLAEAIPLVKEWENQAETAGFAYLSLGCALPSHPEAFEWISPLLAATQRVFLTGLLTTPNQQVDFQAARHCAQVILDNAPLEANGFANLRFAALANVPPGCPFLPAAYHTPGQPPAYALGFECADTILRIFQEAQTLSAARQNLINELEAAATRIGEILTPLQERFGIQFYGYDFSTAPYPQDWCSAGAALEQLGIVPLGGFGSLAAAAFLADTLGRGRWKRAGFNGLMLPVLEDSRLALRSAQGHLTIKDLLLYSTVCGTGLDTLPLPGNCSQETIFALLLDLAALSLRLNKPLTARLMPMPGKQAGDPLTFDFEFFSSGSVMALDSGELNGLLTASQIMDVQPR